MEFNGIDFALVECWQCPASMQELATRKLLLQIMIFPRANLTQCMNNRNPTSQPSPAQAPVARVPLRSVQLAADGAVPTTTGVRLRSTSARDTVQSTKPNSREHDRNFPITIWPKRLSRFCIWHAQCIWSGRKFGSASPNIGLTSPLLASVPPATCGPKYQYMNSFCFPAECSKQIVLFAAYTVNPVEFARLRLCATGWWLADLTL